jgi:hypothetical protein
MTARLSKTLLSPLLFLIATPVQGGSTAGALAIVHFGSEGASGLFLSALKTSVPDLMSDGAVLVSDGMNGCLEARAWRQLRQTSCVSI